MIVNRDLLISIVIPAFNEEKRIVSTLIDLRNTYPGAELIVVDDGSEDRTAEIVKECWPNSKVLINNKNYGKGYSIRRGILEAKGDFICIMDADGAAPASEVERLITYLTKGYDIAIGSRPIKTRPIIRQFVGRCYGILVRLLTGMNFKDTQCGLKAFTWPAGKEIFSNCHVDGFGIDVEALLIAQKFGYRISEVPVVWHEITGSKVNLIKDSIKTFKDLLVSASCVKHVTNREYLVRL